MLQVDWNELVEQVKAHGSENIIFILEDSKTREPLTFDGVDVEWDTKQGMIVVELAAI